MDRWPRFGEWIGHVVPPNKCECSRFGVLPYPRAQWRSGRGISTKWNGLSQRPHDAAAANRTARPHASSGGPRGLAIE